MPTEDFFEPLSDEEVNFCWRCLVDQGQLSVEKLQKFYQEISGEPLSVVQAKDMRNYMDADGNGVVGMEDFKNFMSVCRLQDTDVKSFMWAPKQKWREEHPGWRKDEDEPAAAPAAAGGAGPSRAPGEAAPSAAQPTPPPGKRKGPARPAPAAPAASAAPAAPPAKGPEKSSGSTEQPSGSLEFDAKHLAHIEAVIEKYEQESWMKFAEEEAAFKKRLFQQFAGQDGEMTTLEYHKMLSRWHELTRWCLPSDIQPGDSLATLEYLLHKDREARGVEEPEGEGEKMLPYRVWQDLVDGKFGDKPGKPRPGENPPAAGPAKFKSGS